MKRLVTSFILIISAFGIISAQVELPEFDYEYDMQMYGIGKMPVNSDNEVVFSKVVEVNNMTSDDIYKVMSNTLISCFDVDKISLLDRDKDKAVVTLTAWMYTASHGEFVSAFSGVGFKCYFSVKVQCKDGRYKIEVYNLKGHRDEYRRNNSIYQEENVAAEALNDKVCIKRNGHVREDINGVYRRMIIDCAANVLDRIERNVALNLSNIDVKTVDNW